METTLRIPVPTGNMEPEIERDERGRAHWAQDGSRITWEDVSGAEEGDREILVDVLARHGLSVLHDGEDVIVTADALEARSEQTKGDAR